MVPQYNFTRGLVGLPTLGMDEVAAVVVRYSALRSGVDQIFVDKASLGCFHW